MSRLLPWIALAAGAYASNPDEDSFQRYVENELKEYNIFILQYLILTCVHASEMVRIGSSAK